MENYHCINNTEKYRITAVSVTWRNGELLIFLGDKYNYCCIYVTDAKDYCYIYVMDASSYCCIYVVDAYSYWCIYVTETCRVGGVVMSWEKNNYCCIYVMKTLELLRYLCQGNIRIIAVSL